MGDSRLYNYGGFTVGGRNVDSKSNWTNTQQTQSPDLY